MSDLVTRLRESSGMTTSRSDDGFLSIHPDTDLMRQAADEIEHLRAELDEWKCISEDLYEWTAHVLDRYMTTSAVKAYERKVRGG